VYFFLWRKHHRSRCVCHCVSSPGNSPEFLREPKTISPLCGASFSYVCCIERCNAA
jgi:hypothetical protein